MLQPITRGINGVNTGDFRLAVTTGLVPATVAADAILFSFRWGSTSHRCAIRELALRAQIVTPFTSAQEVSCYAAIGRSFTVAPTDGTALTLTTNSAKLHSHASETTRLSSARVATTAGLTGQTVTVDPHPFLQCLAGNQLLGAAGAAQSAGGALYSSQAHQHPLVLTANEGILVRNGILLGAAGTVRFSIDIEWTEFLNESS